MNPTVLFTAGFAFLLTLSASASPVTGWSVGLDNANLVSLSNTGTSSPTLGDNTADDADNTSIYAPFSSITLGVGDRLTFSGSMQLSTAAGAAPSALANEIRIGVFNQNGSPGLTNWLGYYASTPSGATTAGVRRKNLSTAAYYSQTGTSLLYANSLADTAETLLDATYAFTLSLERTGSGMLIGVTLENDQGYSLVPQTFEDTAANTFTFDRIGFLSGGNLNADQIQFSDLDVTLTPVPEPSSLALFFCGTLVLARYRFNKKIGN